KFFLEYSKKARAVKIISLKLTAFERPSGWLEPGRHGLWSHLAGHRPAAALRAFGNAGGLGLSLLPCCGPLVKVIARRAQFLSQARAALLQMGDGHRQGLETFSRRAQCLQHLM